METSTFLKKRSTNPELNPDSPKRSSHPSSRTLADRRETVWERERECARKRMNEFSTLSL